MGKSYVKMEFSGFSDLIEKLDKLAGGEAVEQAVESGLKAAKASADNQVRKALKKGNLPAKGKYSKGRSLAAIKSKTEVKWNGSRAEIEVGFERNISLTPAFLMYGTPRQKPVRGLKSALSLGKKQKYLITDVVEKRIRRELNGRR